MLSMLCLMIYRIPISDAFCAISCGVYGISFDLQYLPAISYAPLPGFYCIFYGIYVISCGLYAIALVYITCVII